LFLNLSGLIGSGCCIFSKHLITEVFQSRYSLNGFPYKIQHGDWFGGKSVGLARIQFFDMNISIYVTHVRF
jgi:sphingomyelin phosphodiesterase 2